MHTRHLFLIALLMSMSGVALAGEHRPLCEKVKASARVVEIEFQVKGQYPPSMRKKGWGPPESVLKRTRRTGRVTRVFKGDLQVGDPWNPRWDLGFTVGGSSVAAWDRFFRRQTFKHIFFLEKPIRPDGRWRSAGYAEESAPCGGEDSNHRSWCAGYGQYTAAVQACLPPPKKKPQPVPMPMLTSACQHPCADLGAQMIVWRTQDGHPAILQVHGSPERCSHPPTSYFNIEGTQVFSEGQSPVDEVGLKAATEKRTALLSSLTAGEEVTCPEPTEGHPPTEP